MKTLDRLSWYLSWVTVAALAALVVVRRLVAVGLPGWVDTWAVPILTAAAVGYLTNWIAIWLLFKPYKKHWGIQGIIPRSQGKMAAVLGQIIPEHLLKPDELVGRISEMVAEFLQRKDLLDDIRGQVDRFLTHYSGRIVSLLYPYIEGTLRKVIHDNLTPQNVSAIYDAVVVKWMSEESNRKLIASGVVSSLQGHAQEITDAIREKLSEKFGFASNLLPWDSIRDWVAAKLGEESVHKAMSDELNKLAAEVQRWLKTPEAAVKIDAFLTKNREKADAFVKEYLEGHLPGLVDDWLRKDELWEMIRTQVLPFAEKYVRHELKRHQKEIIGAFDLQGTIEKAVNGMDVAELHRMLNKAIGEHLTAIQVLGYGLGALAGLMLIFAK